MERSTANKQASMARRPAPSLVRTAPRRSTPAQALQQRLGNRGAQRVIARSADVAQRAAAAAKSQPTGAVLPSAMRTMRISQPADPAEREAASVARHIVSSPQPASHSVNSKLAKQEAMSDGAAIAPALVQPSLTGAAGNPLPTSVARFMEPRFGAQFGNVRIHTNQVAARQSAAIGAHAFTVGGHIYFGQNQFQPHTTRGRELIAHELTHTIQQGASAQTGTAHRSAAISIHEHSEPALQRTGFDLLSPRQSLASYAANVPGYTLLTVLLGKNPISGVDVARSPANLMRGVIQLLPMGKLITDALGRYSLITTMATWISAQLEPLQAIAHEVRKFIDGVSFSDVLNLEANWDRGVALLKSVEQRVTQFVLGLVSGIVTLIKEAVLKPLAEFAKTTRGYPLLCVILKQDPITKEAVPATPETLLGSFLKFINEEETWNTMQQAKAVPRVYVWFQNAVGVLQSMVVGIPGMFIQAFQSLSLQDILNIPGAFVRLANIFGSFGAQFINWGATAVWTLLEIIFDVVSPGALAYIKRTGAALRSIFRNPLPFINNLVRAAKAGFLNFADNFLTHLKSGLINWLTGSLPGIYIPKAFTLMEIARFVFSALGLTWSNIRVKLVKAVGETAVKVLETGFDIVVTLVRDGPIAAWDLIKSELDKLQEMVIGGVTDFIVDTVVKKAIPKLIAMFIPGVGFVSAIITIYDTVMVFVNKISQMVEVVKGFVDSIIAIAAGNIGSAAKRVETTLAGGLSLAINFLAGFAGLGQVADKVMGVINKIRASIDKALDKVVDWIAKMAKKLVSKAKAGAKKLLNWFKKKVFISGGGEKHTLEFDGSATNPRLVIRSKPQEPSTFLESTAEEYEIPRSKRAKPISDNKAMELRMKATTDQLRKYDDNDKETAGNSRAKKADELAKKLDIQMVKMGAHIGLTLEEWNVANGKVKKFSLSRAKFTVEHKANIAKQHAAEYGKSGLRENKEGKLINVSKGLARRHIVSSHDMAEHYETHLLGKTVAACKVLLEKRASISEALVSVDTLTSVGVAAAARKRYEKFFGYTRNIFIGDSKENSRIQHHLDAGRPDMSRKELDEHVRHIKRSWALDSTIDITPVKEDV